MDSTNSTHMRYKDTCRVCMANNKQFLDIFRYQKRNIPDEIHFATGVLINARDNLPPNICVVCLKQLSVACNFKQKCLKADEVFRQVLVEHVDFGDHFEDNEQAYRHTIYEVDIVKEDSELSSSSNNFENASETKNKNLFKNIKIEKPEEFDQDINTLDTVHTIKNETTQIEIKNEEEDDVVREHVQISKQNDKKPFNKRIRIKKEGIRKKKAGNTFKCEICNLELALKKSLIFHVHRKHLKEAKKLSCPICKQKCACKTDLDDHLKDKPSIYSCDLCPSKCHSKQTLWRHMRLKHGGVFKKPGKIGKYCTVCNTGYDSLPEFVKHQQDVHGVTEFLCPVCNQRFDNRDELQNHLNEKKSIYSCDKCPSKFHHKHSYWYHMTRKHDGIPKKPKSNERICTLCNITFECLSDFKKHQQEMHEAKHVCEVCGKQFGLYITLVQHKRIHGPALLECDYCGYKTVNRTDLIKHLNIHSGVKKFTCEFCKRDFTFKQNLVTHKRRVHLKNQERNFKCTTCEKRFTSRQCLERHYVGHLGIKNFFCEHCSSGFVHYKGYKKHLIRQHNIVLPNLVAGRKRTNIVES